MKRILAHLKEIIATETPEPGVPLNPDQKEIILLNYKDMALQETTFEGFIELIKKVVYGLGLVENYHSPEVADFLNSMRTEQGLPKL